MKMKLILLCFACLLTNYTLSQSPVSWKFYTIKMGNSFKLVVQANIAKDWHLFSTVQGADAIAMPTKISVDKNPMFSPQGNIKEIGRMEVKFEKITQTSANQFQDSVKFVQVFKIKNNIRTNIRGKLHYQVCTDDKCLPKQTVAFSLPLPLEK